MGTEIEIVAIKGDDTPEEIWDKFTDRFKEVYGTDTDTGKGDSIIAYSVHCPYSMACLEIQLKPFEEFKGQGITFELKYLERDPDETMEL